MKRFLSVLLVFSLMLPAAQWGYAEPSTYSGLKEMTHSELNSLLKDIDTEVRTHHDPSEAEKEKILSVIQKEVESIYEANGISVSWAWYDREYTYGENWNDYTFKSHIDYKNEKKRNVQKQISAELVRSGDGYAIVWIKADDTFILDNRDRVAVDPMNGITDFVINAVTGENLTYYSLEELKSFAGAVKDEIELNHTPGSDTEETISLLTKLYTEKALDIADVSWGWSFDSACLRAWDLYAYKNTVSYTDKGNGGRSEKNVPVLSAMYFGEYGYELCFLSVNKEIKINQLEIVEPLMLRDLLESLETEEDAKLLQDALLAKNISVDTQSRTVDIGSQSRATAVPEAPASGEPREENRGTPVPDMATAEPTVRPTDPPESNNGVSASEEPAAESEIITIDNCPEFAAMLKNLADMDPSYSAFAAKYEGRMIEFDGRIDYVTTHEKYKTRFDILVSAGDFDPDHMVGPAFKFEDVACYDMDLGTMYLEDEIWVGRNVHIIARVVKYNENSGLFFLDPVSVSGR